MTAKPITMPKASPPAASTSLSGLARSRCLIEMPTDEAITSMTIAPTTAPSSATSGVYGDTEPSAST